MAFDACTIHHLREVNAIRPHPTQSIPSVIVDTTPCSDHAPPSTNVGGSADKILADLCKAISDSHGLFRPSLSEVEALLGDNGRQPLHVTVLGSSAQQYEFEVCHFMDLTAESYVTDCVEIVVYYWWVA